MSTAHAERLGAGRVATIQHADDLQRDRAVRRPAAAPRLLATYDPLPSARSGADRRLCGHVSNPSRQARADRDADRPDGRLPAVCRRSTRPQDRGRLGPRRAAGLGAQFGEVNSTIHQKLGCVGHITSGCPRDLDEVEALGFQLFGLNPCVSHAYVRLVDFGSPVMIGGVEIHSGDLIHADKHGVCLIPHAVAPRLAAACVEVESRERPLLEICRSDELLARGVPSTASRARQAKISEMSAHVRPLARCRVAQALSRPVADAAA